MLADAYVRADWFPLTPPALLVPGARVGAVLALAAMLDVLAFQEADPALVAAARTALPGYDVRWCPKDRGRPVGCLTAVRGPWRISTEDRVVYPDGNPISGHVAHVLRLVEDTGHRATVANTHLRWQSPDTPAADHLGLRQATALVAALADDPVAAIATDSNDAAGGPVRRLLARAGFTEAQVTGPTSLVNGTDGAALDIVTVRGAAAHPIPTGLAPVPPLPGPSCPADHLPLVVELAVPGPD